MKIAISGITLALTSLTLGMVPTAATASGYFETLCKSLGGSYGRPNYINNLSMVSQVGPYIRPTIVFAHNSNYITANPEQVGKEAFEILHTAFLYRRKVGICMKDVDYDPNTQLNLLLGVEIEASPPATAEASQPEQ